MTTTLKMMIGLDMSNFNFGYYYLTVKKFIC
jgi:hypothetical protein